MKNYVVFHLHDMHSILDSTTCYKDYINKAKELNMTAIAFSNHGNIFDWVQKKMMCDELGIKYIHGVEMYITETFENKVADNFHIGIYAKNFKGIKELNKLISISNDEKHKYYKPRISLEELYSTSNDLIITTACLGSPVWYFMKNKQSQKLGDFFNWAFENKDRVFLEIQYHDTPEQIKYNKLLSFFAKKYNLNLIAGTDTHNIDEEKSKSRWILKKAKKMTYIDEDYYDLNFKTYNELVTQFQKQNSIPMQVVLEAIENTNHFADLVESFELNKEYKYPNIYSNIEYEINEILKKKLKRKLS